MVEFAYKLLLHYAIYMLVFSIWTIKIIKTQIPASYMQKETYHENRQNEIFKIKDVQNMF